VPCADYSEEETVRRKQVWRYYCEHCKKSGCNAVAIRDHEEGCTANPARVCKLCKAAGLEGNHNSVPDLVFIFKANETLPVVEQMKLLRESVEGCPACILATLRQAKVLGYKADGDFVNYEFNFKAEKEAWWSEINANHREHESYGYA
jgi:hypothetical protein